MPRYLIALAVCFEIAFVPLPATASNDSCEIALVRQSVHADSIRLSLTISDGAIEMALAIAREESARRPLEFARELLAVSLEDKSYRLEHGPGDIAERVAALERTVDFMATNVDGVPGDDAAATRDQIKRRVLDLRHDVNVHVVDRLQISHARAVREHARLSEAGRSSGDPYVWSVSRWVAESAGLLAGSGGSPRLDGDLTPADVRRSAAQPPGRARSTESVP